MLSKGRSTPKKPDKPKSNYQEKYWETPSVWARDNILWRGGEHLTFYQEEILDAIPKRRRVAVRGPHGLGKTSLAAIAFHWFALTRDTYDWKIITTASVWRQLEKYLWPEIHKWARRIDWDKIGREPYKPLELQTLQLKLETGEGFAVASSNHEYIEGAHADYLFYIFDEAKAIPEQTFDAAEGAFSGAGEDTGVQAYALAISTPGDPIGRFYNIHRRDAAYHDWWARHVTVNEAIKAGRISKEWAESRKIQWGETSSLYRNRVLGEFGSSDSEGVLPSSWLQLAIDRYPDDVGEMPEIY